MVLLSAQRMALAGRANVAFTSRDPGREVLHNFNDDDYDSLDAKYARGRPSKFGLPQRQAIKGIPSSRPVEDLLE